MQRLVVPGNCGKLDVEDCYASIRHLIDSGIAEEGPGKQFVVGGSHGGFLVAHRMSPAISLRNSSFFIFYFSYRSISRYVFCSGPTQPCHLSWRYIL